LRIPRGGTIGGCSFSDEFAPTCREALGWLRGCRAAVDLR
jgi:hypothetical protein